MMIPSLPKCLGIYAVRILLFLTAWFLVPIGMLVGGIKKGPRAFGQWSGAECQPDGTMLTKQTVESIVTSGFWNVFDIPDDPGIGNYECTVADIYRKCGWWVAVYYQLAFRNVGQGWLAMYRVPLAYDVDLRTLETTTMGITHGLKRYGDWRKYPDAVQPFLANQRLYYGIPNIGKEYTP